MTEAPQMDCITFRRLLATEPHNETEAMRQHIGHCPSCRAAAEVARRFEAQLRRALEVDVPPDLTERLLSHPRLTRSRSAGAPRTGETHPKHPRRGNQRRIFAALAASIIAGCLLVFAVTSHHEPAPSALEGAVVDAIRDQFISLTATGAVGPAELGSTLQAIGLSLRTPLEDVRFAANCVIRGSRAAHWVLAGERAPITVFVMPAEDIGQRTAIGDGAMQGFLEPLPGGGTLAVVGAAGESLEGIGQRVTAALQLPALEPPLG